MSFVQTFIFRKSVHLVDSRSWSVSYLDVTIEALFVRGIIYVDDRSSLYYFSYLQEDQLLLWIKETKTID